jgi:hypothetical protein
MGDCFVPRSDGSSTGFRGSSVIGRNEAIANTTRVYGFMGDCFVPTNDGHDENRLVPNGTSH